MKSFSSILLIFMLSFYFPLTGFTERNEELMNWGMTHIQAPQSWSSGYTGKGVKIAIIDSGVIKSHPDLSIAGGASFLPYTDSYNDDHGHGTHIAGIIGAKHNGQGVAGVAPDAELYVLKAANFEGEGKLSYIASAIHWAIDNHVDIINLSLGYQGKDTEELSSAIDRAYRAGILLVAAAGNEGDVQGTGDTIDYPAKYPSVIAVGAINQEEKRLIRTESPQKISATGSSLEIVGPGDKIYSTLNKDQYGYMTGTSMAAAYVTGVLALYKQQHPYFSNEQLRHMLQENAIDLGEEGWDSWYGYGLAQAPRGEKQSNSIDRNESIEGTLTNLQQDNDAINVMIDTVKVSFEVQPINREGRILIPLRGIFEFLGAQVTWNSSEKRVLATKEDKSITLTIGSTHAILNSKDINLDIPAQIINSRTFVPLRFVSESLGAKVNWDQDSKTVSIESIDTSTP